MTTSDDIQATDRAGVADGPSATAHEGALPAGGAVPDAPFWESKALGELSRSQWEALCDGCGRCCLLKLEDEETGEIALTRVACRLLDIGACRCSDYARRHEKVADCLEMDADVVPTLEWLPKTCAYRLRSEGKPLAWWHPLVSGSRETVHEAGISVRSFASSETRVHEDDLDRFIIADR